MASPLASAKCEIFICLLSASSPPQALGKDKTFQTIFKSATSFGDSQLIMQLLMRCASTYAFVMGRCNRGALGRHTSMSSLRRLSVFKDAMLRHHHHEGSRDDINGEAT